MKACLIIICSLLTYAAAADFSLRDNKTNKTCLFAQLEVIFHINYVKNDSKPASTHFKLPEDSKATGSCAGNGSSAKLQITFVGPIDVLELEFTKDKNHTVLSSVSFKFVFEQAHFPDLRDGDKNKSGSAVSKEALQLCPTNMYYACMSPEEMLLASDKTPVNLTLSDVQFQVFDIKDGKMSKDDRTCAGDRTSTAAPSTTPKVPGAGTWNVSINGTVCVMAQMGIRMKITYTNNKNKSVSVDHDLPEHAMVDDKMSKCNTSEDELVLTFFGKWHLGMKFTKDKSKAYVSTIMMMYEHDTALLPNISTKGETHVNATGLQLFKASTSNYYKCNAEKDQAVQSVNLHFYDVQIQSFRNDKDSGFKGTAEECSDDEKTSALVPIVVGAALAALVVIVLIAYLIGRKRRQSGYESV